MTKMRRKNFSKYKYIWKMTHRKIKKRALQTKMWLFVPRDLFSHYQIMGLSERL